MALPTKIQEVEKEERQRLEERLNAAVLRVQEAEGELRRARKAERDLRADYARKVNLALPGV